MNTETLCRIHVRFGDNEIELEGDREFVQETLKDFKGGIFSMPVVSEIQAENALNLEDEVMLDRNSSISSSAPSLAGFLREMQMESHPDISIAIAVYLYQYRSIKTFTKADIENSYREALLSKSKNFSQDINRNRKKGYVDITNEKRDGLVTFHVTQQGIDYVGSFKNV
jgi:hypothetical protein